MFTEFLKEKRFVKDVLPERAQLKNNIIFTTRVFFFIVSVNANACPIETSHFCTNHCCVFTQFSKFDQNRSSHVCHALFLTHLKRAHHSRAYYKSK